MVFDQISGYWTEMVDAHSTEKQVSFVLRHLDAEGLVLDLCCGNGRHTIPLCKAGYNIVGLDASPRLLQLAKRKAAKAGAGLALIKADMRFLPFRLEIFAAVLSLDTSFGYLSSEGEDLRSLTELSRTLVDQGVLLLDVFNHERERRHHGKKVGFEFWNFVFCLLQKFPWFSAFFRWREFTSFFLLQKRSMEAKTGLMRDLWAFRDKKTARITIVEHVVRLYASSRLKTLLGVAGLEILGIFGSYEEEEYWEESGRLIIYAEKTISLRKQE